MPEAEPTGTAPPGAATDPRTRRRGRIIAVVRVAVTIAAFVWVLSRVELPALYTALTSISPLALLAAFGLTAANLVVGAARWKVMLAAYGATRLPPLSRLVALNYIGFFYNTWLPGGVGGDVVRGVASREAFGEAGTTGAMAVVFVDRVLGLTGLFLVVATTALLRPMPGAAGGSVAIGSMLGIAAGIAAVAGIALGRRLSPHLPGSLGRIAAGLPPIVRAVPFAVALLLSLVTQSIVAVTGHVVVSALAPIVTFETSLVVVPLAMATGFLPFLVGGTGAREEVFAQLYGAVGVTRPDAIAASLLVYLTQLAIGLVGAALPMPKSSPVPEVASRAPPA